MPSVLTPPPERVWIVAGIPGSLPGGMKRHVSLHARGLEAAGVTARLLFTEEGFSRPNALARRLPGAFMLAAQLPHLRAERPDVVNVHTLSAPAWLAARRLGAFDAKVVVMSYGADERAMAPPRSAGDRLRRWRISVPARALFPTANGVWCVNSEDAAYYREEYGIPADRVAVLPHAIEDRFFAPAPAVIRDWRRLLFVGTPIHRKGFDVLIATLAEVLARQPAASAVLAGTLSPCNEMLTGVPEALRRRIEVIPFAEDEALHRLYNSCGLILVPSRFEGLPFSLLEAMACGCPALAAANSGMIDAIREGVNGWLQRDFNVAGWARRVEELWKDLPALERASAGARREAENYRLGVLTDRALDWYRAL